ncbi:hypothetical protein BS47DRAFT_1353627 [Hydnum rufescens UP504]|uniref:Uncharacterized protein n=1 Tax=Hydnum rufescens UP504 TaxID=1448309 RepID=A0A9P6AI53_9AGAM|nr:hypothetical protein BS47DRAFT_1353627 [Hydnum rufescens UP504]
MPRHRTILKTFPVAKARSQANIISPVHFKNPQASIQTRPVRQRLRGNLYVNDNDYNACLALRRAQRKLARKRAGPGTLIVRQILGVINSSTKENEMEIDSKPSSSRRARPRRQPRPTAVDLLDECVRSLSLSDDDDAHTRSHPGTTHISGNACWPTSSHSPLPPHTPLDSQASRPSGPVGNLTYPNPSPSGMQQAASATSSLYYSDLVPYTSSFASERSTSPGTQNQTLHALHEHFSHLIALLGANSELLQKALSRFQSALKLASPLAPIPPSLPPSFIYPEIVTYLQTIQDNKPSSAADDASSTIAKLANEIMYLLTLLAQDISLFCYYQ